MKGINYDVFLDGKSCSNFGFYPVRRPDIPSAKPRESSYQIVGRDGDVYERSAEFEDVEITIEFNFKVKDDYRFNSVWRSIRRFVMGAEKLQLQDDQEVFYKIKTAAISDVVHSNNSYKIGAFSVTFTLAPYAYHIATMGKTGAFVNPYDLSCPGYHITPIEEKSGSISVDGNTVSFDLPFKAPFIIDSELLIAYRADTLELWNKYLTGDLRSLRMDNGTHYVEGSYGFEIAVKTEWREVL